MSTRCVVFSLYGKDPIYTHGLVENVPLIREVYPGWGVRVYCDSNSNIPALEELGCDVQRRPLSRRHSGMFWRFLAAWDTDLERVIFRDADSRVNVREAAAVQEWIESGRILHCIHDHPHHTNLPIQGGMWGIRVGHLPGKMYEEVQQLSLRPQKRVKDMRWLRDHLYPLVEHSVMRHSSVPLQWDISPFPDHPEYDGFVGQRYDMEGESF